MFRFASNLSTKNRLTKDSIQPISYGLSSIRSFAAEATIQNGDEEILTSNANNHRQKTKDPDVKDKAFVPNSISNDGGARFMQYLASRKGLSNK